MRLLDRLRGGRGRGAEGRLSEAGRRIRAHLDAGALVRASVHEIRRAHPDSTPSIWLAESGHRLRCVHPADRTAPPGEHVVRCAKRHRTVRGPGCVAVAIQAPRTGFQGVLEITGMDPGDDLAFVEGLSWEIGLALQTAALYARAVAEKERSVTILERVGDAVVVTDPSGKILHFNRSAEQMVGRAAREVVGRRCREVLGLRAGDKELDCSRGCALASAAAGSQSALGIEVWRPLADGRRQPLLASVARVGEGSSSSEVVHSFRDITRLKEADEAKTLFLATASHELKTPLTVIQGFSDLLLETEQHQPEGTREALEAIANRAQGLNKIVDRILLSSRIEAGRATVSLADVDAGRILRERTAAFAGSTGRDISLEITEPLPQVRGDADAIATAVDHLVDNAIKYSPGGERVVVSAFAASDRVRFSVADGGIGMDAEQAERCFEKFWQAESTDVRRFGGTGIGLFIVRSLVQAMGGEVQVESRRGKGSTFVVVLRRATPITPGLAERSQIREFMRQIGISEKGAS